MRVRDAGPGLESCQAQNSAVEDEQLASCVDLSFTYRSNGMVTVVDVNEIEATCTVAATTTKKVV